MLPREWLEWHGKPVVGMTNDDNSYDIIFHLFGEQRIPSLLGVKQFSSKKHIFVNSKQYPSDVMKEFLRGTEYGEITVDPYKPENVYSMIREEINKMPSHVKIGFNLTGGTKLMYIGAYNACMKENATPFYFDMRNNQVVFLRDYKRSETVSISSVEDFIRLNAGDGLSAQNVNYQKKLQEIKDREELTNKMWEKRSDLSKFYQNTRDNNEGFKPFEYDNEKNIYFKLSKDKSVKVNIDRQQFEYKEWPNFATYCYGGWFEEYIFLKLQPLVDSGFIKDMRIGFHITYKESSVDKNTGHKARDRNWKELLKNQIGNLYNEFDILLTDGRRLYIIECKAGRYNKSDKVEEYINKLSNTVNTYGGSDGMGFLVSCFDVTNNVSKKKIDENKNIRFVFGDEVVDLLKKEIIQSKERCL